MSEATLSPAPCAANTEFKPNLSGATDHMAWNEPGGDRNPWGNRPDRGSADLDEALRNLQRKLSSLLGGGGRGSNGGGGGDGDGGRGRPGALLGFGAGTVALVLLGVWAATGFYVVDAAERALVTRFGKYSATTEPGLRWHLPWPIEARQIINVESIQGYSDQTRMLTSDENQVDIDISVQWRAAEPKAFAYNVRDPEDTLRGVSQSAIREVVGRSKLDFVLEEGRQEIATHTRELIQRTLDSYGTGIEVTTVNLEGVNVPEQVQTAQRDAIKAREDKERLGLEAQAYANDILPKARGSAVRQSEDSEAYKARIVADAEGEAARFSKVLLAYERAPEVTRKRLYYETMEEVLGSTNKVLVDSSEGGGGNIMYLPLDKLAERRAPTLTLDQQRQGSSEQTRDAIVDRSSASTPDNATLNQRERGSR
jgi:membrane protease subunit HflK